MEYLIQNTSSAPIFVPVVIMKEGKPSAEGTIVLEGNNEVTKISAEVYENSMLKNDFYRQKIEKGEIIVLNGSSSAVDQAVASSVQSRELGYSRYVALVQKIESSGGLAESRLRPYLDSDGFPGVDLCRKNLGDNVDPAVLDQYRSRYIVEKANGMHQSVLVLPGGKTMTSMAGNTSLKEENVSKESDDDEDENEVNLDSMSLEGLKALADELGVTYEEDISFARLRGRIKKQMKKENE